MSRGVGKWVRAGPPSRTLGCQEAWIGAAFIRTSCPSSLASSRFLRHHRKPKMPSLSLPSTLLQHLHTLEPRLTPGPLTGMLFPCLHPCRQSQNATLSVKPVLTTSPFRIYHPSPLCAQGLLYNFPTELKSADTGDGSPGLETPSEQGQALTPLGATHTVLQ